MLSKRLLDGDDDCYYFCGFCGDFLGELFGGRVTNLTGSGMLLPCFGIMFTSLYFAICFTFSRA